MSGLTLPAWTRVVLLDVEGTVGDVRFVSEVLFPYARARLELFVASYWAQAEVAAALAEAARVAGLDATDRRGVVDALLTWSDANAKVGPLKTLQGLLWEAGYREGALRAHVYADVPGALRGWKGKGLRLAVYSSGSVLAQRLYFTHSTAGDLSPLFDGHFDTSTGAKGDPASYGRIAEALQAAPREVTFFSDSRAEVDAALTAGVHAVRIDRGRSPEERGRDPEGNDWSGALVET